MRSKKAPNQPTDKETSYYLGYARGVLNSLDTRANTAFIRALKDRVSQIEQAIQSTDTVNKRQIAFLESVQTRFL